MESLHASKDLRACWHACAPQEFGFRPISGIIAKARTFSMEYRGFLLQKPFPLLGNLSKVLAAPVLKSRPKAQGLGRGQMISVVIPAHNEERYLRKTLDALQHQNYGLFEVIVVANGCTDGTKEVARGRCQRLIVLSERNLGMSRNLGARMASGELLLFLDADTILEPMTLRVISESFSKTDSAGTIHGRPDDDRLPYRFIYGLKNFIHRSAIHPGSSGVILCWKDHFFRVGGFDEGLAVRENSELLKRLKRFGHYKYIGEVTATTSMRRYERCGIGHVVWLWCKLWFESFLCDLHHKQYDAVR